MTFCRMNLRIVQAILESLPRSFLRIFINFVPDICTLPKKVGDCKASIKQWYFDNESKKCEWFLYGGCDGNANRYILN